MTKLLKGARGSGLTTALLQNCFFSLVFGIGTSERNLSLPPDLQGFQPLTIYQQLYGAAEHFPQFVQTSNEIGNLDTYKIAWSRLFSEKGATNSWVDSRMTSMISAAIPMMANTRTGPFARLIGITAICLATLTSPSADILPIIDTANNIVTTSSATQLPKATDRVAWINISNIISQQFGTAGKKIENETNKFFTTIPLVSSFSNEGTAIFDTYATMQTIRYTDLDGGFNSVLPFLRTPRNFDQVYIDIWSALYASNPRDAATISSTGVTEFANSMKSYKNNGGASKISPRVIDFIADDLLPMIYSADGNRLNLIRRLIPCMIAKYYENSWPAAHFTDFVNRIVQQGPLEYLKTYRTAMNTWLQAIHGHITETDSTLRIQHNKLSNIAVKINPKDPRIARLFFALLLSSYPRNAALRLETFFALMFPHQLVHYPFIDHLSHLSIERQFMDKLRAANLIEPRLQECAIILFQRRIFPSLMIQNTVPIPGATDRAAANIKFAREVILAATDDLKRLGNEVDAFLRGAYVEPNTSKANALGVYRNEMIAFADRCIHFIQTINSR